MLAIIMKTPKNPHNSIESVIKNSELQNLTQNYAELAIDGFIDDGVLKDIPLAGSIIGVIKFGNSINKHITAKKIYKFLIQLSSIPQEKRIAMIDEINKSKKYQSTVGEMIFEILDKIESDGKPEIVGKLLASYFEGKISFQTYLKLVHIVKSVFYYDLLMLINYDENNYLYEGNSEQFSSLGLTSFGYDAWEKPSPKEKCSGEISKIGKLIVDFRYCQVFG